MKRIITLLTALTLIIGLISVMPLYFAEGDGFGLVTSPTDGKEYILVWNKNLNDSLGDKYALAADRDGVKAVKVTDDDLANGDVTAECKWILEYVSGGIWNIKNAETGMYLNYVNDAEDELDKINFVSSKQTNGTTSWKLKSGSVSSQFLPSSNTGVKIRYSVSSVDFMIRHDDNNSWVWLYEKGAVACTEHTYSGCTATVCDNCGLKARDEESLSHTYSSDDDTECDKCGYIRHIFGAMDTDENTAVKEFIVTFKDNGYDSVPNDNYSSMFNLTSMVASIAPLEDVTHIDITLEASNIDGFDSAIGTLPSCQLFWNGWWNTLVETKQFGSNPTMTFSADVDPENVHSIWLLPYAFTPEIEISFRIAVRVTYTESDTTVNYGDPIASLVLFSDYQMWGSDVASNNGEGLKANVNDIFNTMGKVDPDYVIFGGDFGCTFSTEGSNYGRTQVLNLVSKMWDHIGPDNGSFIQVEGNHDTADMDGFMPTGGYEYDDFIVYVLNEDDLPWKMYETSEKAICEATAKKLTEYFDSLIEAGEKRPVFIASHTALHYDAARLDANNQYSYIVFDAINKAAESLDIVFLFGHNHSTGDPEVGGSVVFKTVGDTLYVSDENCYDSTGNGLRDRLNIGRPEKLNFTYMTYGYVGYVGYRLSDYEVYDVLDPETVLTISDLKIFEDKMTVTVYSAGGRISALSQEIARKNVVVNEEPPISDTDGNAQTPAEENSAPVGAIVAISAAVVVCAIVVIIALKAKKK